MRQLTSKIAKTLVMAAALAMLASPAMAQHGKNIGDGTGDGTPDRDRLRDGSCLDLTGGVPGNLLAGHHGNRSGDRDGTPDRDRLKDGSCRITA